MNLFGKRRRRSMLVATSFLGLVFLLPALVSQGQEQKAETTTPPAAAAQTEAGQPAGSNALVAPAAGQGTVTAPATTTGTAEQPISAATADKTGETSKANTQTGGKAAPVQTGTAAATAPAKSGMPPYVIGAIIVALFVLPVMAGNYLAKIWRMPDHAWKFSLTLGLLAASLVIVMLGEFKFGPDLAGGITLVYELADTRSKDVPVGTLIDALKRRVDPTGTREVTIRRHGANAVEIIIPQTGPDALDYVKRQITEMGQLEFRITADPARNELQLIVQEANLLAGGQKDVMHGGKKVAEWVAYDEREFGPVNSPDHRIVKRNKADYPEALVLIDDWGVTGDDLTSARKGVDERGGPAVHFSFNSRGAAHFGQLTADNLPNRATGALRNLGIVLDKRLISAPSINSKISDSGMISGGGMDEKEVDHIVGILMAGRLPATLNKTPISQETISPTLGAVTVEKGKVAIVASLLAVVLFMIVYYRFAGLVACIALTFNLLLVLALMVLIKGAFTLPGLAGLVLTIGMSVDANVLIYERIREELKNGAALRMAIRNGFGRAMSAIVDSNLTTVISGIALYAFATDQVKGFAVTLILGIITSMFTAIFVARLIFDVVERRGWVKTVRMMRIMETPNYDFLGVRYVAVGASLVIIAIGMIAVYFRGSTLLDIDFSGGSSVAFTLKENAKMPIAEVRDAMAKTSLADKNLLVVEHATDERKNSRYAIDTSEQSIDQVEQVIQDTFGNKLMTYSLQVGPLTSYTDGELKGTEAKLLVNDGKEYDSNDGISHDAIIERLRTSLDEFGHKDTQPTATSNLYQIGSNVRYKDWTVRMPGLDEATAQPIFDKLKSQMNSQPMFPLANTIGGRVSGDMKKQAAAAIFISLLGMVVYLWFRFQKLSYGLAAAAALLHDVLVTIGMLALSKYIVEAVPPLASLLQIQSFQISLTIVAALLTIIGYSVNDTIVTFDRLREIKGKSARLTPEMVNASVNQTLGRTILTSLTVFIVIVILYFWGGEGIHSFAFSFLVGVIAGTYSTVYIAAPVLLWLSGSSTSLTEKEGGSTAIGRPATA